MAGVTGDRSLNVGSAFETGYYGAQSMDISPASNAGERNHKSPGELGVLQTASSDSRLQTSEKAHVQAEPSPFTKTFRARRQLKKLLFDSFIRWLMTLAIVLILVGVVRVFQNKENMTRTKYHWYNAISVGLQLCLGLNLQSAIGEAAKMLRWRILAVKPHPVDELDLILGADSFSALSSMFFRYLITSYEAVFGPVVFHRKVQSQEWVGQAAKMLGKRRPSLLSDSDRPHKHARQPKLAGQKLWTAGKILCWLLLNLGAQISVALISVDSSASSGPPLRNPVPIGPTYVSDINAFLPYFNFTHDEPTSTEQQFAAYNMGLASTPFDYINISGPADPATFASTEDTYFLSNTSDPPFWFFRYFNFDGQYHATYKYSVPSDRTIQVGWYNRGAWPITRVQYDNETSGPLAFNNSAEITYNGLSYPFENIGPGATTYQFTNLPCTAGNQRCAVLRAWQHFVEGYGMPENGTAYECEIQVDNVMQDLTGPAKYNLPESAAQYAAAAIGLNGYNTGNITHTLSGTLTGSQFTRYTEHSYWSLHGYSGEQACMRMAEFSVGSIVSQNLYNPKFKTIGEAVELGEIVDPNWGYLSLNLGLIVGLHFVLGLLVVLATHKFVQPDDSFITIARLLKPVLGTGPGAIGDDGAGAVMDSSDVIHHINDNVLLGQDLVYVVRPSKSGSQTLPRHTLQLYASPSGEEGKTWGQKLHPDGKYD